MKPILPVFLLLALVGCPRPHDGQKCSGNPARQCASGYRCFPDGLCHLSGYVYVASADMATTPITTPADLATTPITTEVFWIGSGGSASHAAMTEQLNVNVGGSNTLGCSAPPGSDCTNPNASHFTAGFFATQTY